MSQYPRGTGQPPTPPQPQWQPPVRRRGAPAWLVVTIALCTMVFGFLVGVVGTAASSNTDAVGSGAPTQPSGATAQPGKAEKVTKREWAKIVKNPDAHVGERYVIYGKVTQFDTATGTSSFRADTAHKDTMEYGYFDGVNTVLDGTEEQLSDVVADDVFKATVTVLGAYDYKTQIGGATVVPHLQVDKIQVIAKKG